MPPKRTNIGRKSNAATRVQRRRLDESFDDREARIRANQDTMLRARANETPEIREARIQANRDAMQLARANETPENREARIQANRDAMQLARANETPENREARIQANRDAMQLARANETLENRETRTQANRNAMQLVRTNETPADREARMQANRDAMRLARANETPENRDARTQADREAKQVARTNATPGDREARMQANRDAMRLIRADETPEDRRARLQTVRQTMQVNRRGQTGVIDFKNSAFNYDIRIDYSAHPLLQIGRMSQVCNQCGALKWKEEPNGMCCMGGKIDMPLSNAPPEPLDHLLSGMSADSNHFLENIQRYNNAFQMTSFGANIVREGAYMPTFKVQGQIYHQIGPLLPPTDHSPKFLQIYFIGNHQTESITRFSDGLKQHIIRALQDMLHSHNSYIESFKYALESNVAPNVDIVIDANKKPSGEHRGRFNEPTCSEVAVVITGQEHGARDIVIHSRDNQIRRICETHRSYDPLQYPLLNVRGEDGYRLGIPHAIGNRKVSCREFYCYNFMVRDEQFNHFHRCRNLANQFAVDMYAKIESERLFFIRSNQKKLRADSYIHLCDSINNDTTEGLGQLCILPSTFTGSPRYMQEKTQDAMALVRHFGRPDLFITFTCNPGWPEVKNELFNGQKPADRHDILARVFHLKLKTLMHLIKQAQIFGPTKGDMHTIEWQKRGLPHSHILVWLENRIHTDDIDSMISAELPNPELDSKLFETIKSQMIHGPCGRINESSPCMKNGKCTKNYPRQFLTQTQTSKDGYPLYRRRSPDESGFTASIRLKNGQEFDIDNRWVVPHCPLLAKAFDAHINVEYCSSVKSIKYICKYVNKGSDAAMFALRTTSENDEVTRYEHGRYLSSNEAFWRIFDFSIHERHPAVVRLAVHLENGQRVYFTDQTSLEVATAPKDTTLSAYFKLCQEDAFAKTLLYMEVPSYYTFAAGKWTKRKRGTAVEGEEGIMRDTAIGRIFTVHPTQHECFFLRALLLEVRGPTSFGDLRTVDGEVCSTFREAAQKRGLTEDDRQWDATLTEASVSRSPRCLRNLFAVLLNVCGVGDAPSLWDKFKIHMSEDFRHRIQTQNHDIEVPFNDDIFNMALVSIENTIVGNGGPEIHTFGLPITRRTDISDQPREIIREMSYNINDLADVIRVNEPQLLPEQRKSHDTILTSVENNTGGIFFLDAPGGTGKTFLINLILAKVRVSGNLAIAVASSGIAATLLPGGRTAHSAFKLPINLVANDMATCNVTKGTGLSVLLQRCRLIVWDECTMAHKHAFEALDRTLRDIRNCDMLMGGVTFLISGDFRQTLPVVPRGTRADHVNACLKSSYIWSSVRSLHLKTNMRARLSHEPDAMTFATKLLDIGEGVYPVEQHDQISLEDSSLCSPIRDLNVFLEVVFPNLEQNMQNLDWLSERAILAPTNVSVDSVNHRLLDALSATLHTYKSVDSVPDPTDIVNYPTEFLNSLNPPGMPPHVLNLKDGVPIMLLRNLDPPKLCNGTRLTVRNMLPHVIEARILTGCGKGDNVFIPRIPLIPTDCPVEFKRLQFPVRPSFAITINKAQGQTFKEVGVMLQEPCFSHGQLYVALSRVGNPTKLFVYTSQQENVSTNNVVYREVIE